MTTGAEALPNPRGWLRDAGFDGTLIFGDADSVGERIQQAVDMGLDGVTVDLPVNGHNVERIALLGEIALKALP